MDPLRSRVSLIGLGKRSIRMVVLSLWRSHTPSGRKKLCLGIERHREDILIGGDRLRNVHNQGTLRCNLSVGVSFHLQLDHAQAGRAVAGIGELEGRGQPRILAEDGRQGQVTRVARALDEGSEPGLCLQVWVAFDGDNIRQVNRLTGSRHVDAIPGMHDGDRDLIGNPVCDGFVGLRVVTDASSLHPVVQA